MSKKRIKRNAIAWGVTIAVHAMVLATLFLLHLHASQRDEPEELLLINFGTTDQLSAGLFEPSAASAATSPEVSDAAIEASVPQKTQTKPQEVSEIKQNIDPSISMAEKQRQKAEAERIRREEALKKQKAAEEAERRKREEAGKAISSNVAGAFGKGDQMGTNQGTGTVAQGNQGHIGGSGSSYSLTGRTIIGNGGYPERPKYNTPTRGTINVTIVVNASGKVTQARVRLRGTNITDNSLQRAAIEAAKATRFNAAPGSQEQEGVITYHFDVR